MTTYDIVPKDGSLDIIKPIYRLSKENLGKALKNVQSQGHLDKVLVQAWLEYIEEGEQTTSLIRTYSVEPITEFHLTEIPQSPKEPNKR